MPLILRLLVFLLVFPASIAFSETTEAYSNSGLFLPYVAYPMGSWPEAVAIGDVNDDGRNDVVMTTSFYFDEENDYHVHVFLQDASGELRPPVKYPTSAIFNGPQSVDIGDVNNDGLADIVVGVWDGCDNGIINVFLQSVFGGFYPRMDYRNTNSFSIKTGDFNNDGRTDVAGITWGLWCDDVDIMFQNKWGLLSKPVTYHVSHSGYDEIDAGDLNNDGLEDIVVMSGQGSGPNFGVLLQENDGTFGLPAYYDLGYDGGMKILTHGVAVGDVNGDGLEDVAVTYGGNSTGSFVATFLQNDSGTLDPPVSYSSDTPESIEIGDVNADGRMDMMAAHYVTLGVYLQSASGTLMPEELYSFPHTASSNPQGLDIGDINSDGLNDVVAADFNYGLVVLYHTPPARFEETDSNIFYAGAWRSLDCAGCSGGALRYSRQAGGEAVFSFDGTGVRWVSAKGKIMGRARVYIDGEYKATIDLYSAENKMQETAYQTGGLTAGSHTITVEVMARKNPFSPSRHVAIDAFEVIP